MGAYVDNSLAPDEIVVRETQHHWIIYYKLYLSMALNAPRELDGEAPMDPFAKFNQFKRLIDEYERSIDSAQKASPELSGILQTALSVALKDAGLAALSAGLYSEAGDELKRLRDAHKASGSAIGGKFELADLEQSYYAAVGDYESAVRVLDQSWAAIPPAFKRGGTVFPIYYAGKKAGYLAAAGDWDAAATVLSGLELERNENSTFDVDYFVGLRALVHAVLGEPSRHLEEFAAMEKKYRALSGTDIGYHYAAAQAIIYNRRASITGSRADHLKAVEGGREMARTLRAFVNSGFGQTSMLAPTVATMAKEAYVASASALLESGDGTVDDLLDALHLLYFNETDRDISAMMARAQAIPGLSQMQMRQLQDAQRDVSATQQRVLDFAKILDLEPGQQQRAAETARAASRRLDTLLDSFKNVPRFQQAFGNTKPPTMRSLQARLAPGESLALVAPMKDATLVMVISNKTFSQRLVNLPASRAAGLVKRIRNSVNLDRDRLPAFDVEAASELFSALFGWEPGLLKQTRYLTVISDGVLAATPFSLLVTQPQARDQKKSNRDTPWLIRAMSVTHAPSIRSWYAVSEPHTGAQGQRLIAWANPAYDGASREAVATNSRAVRGAVRPMQSDKAMLLNGLPADLAQQLEPLPETFDEASAIAQALGSPNQSTILHGQAATRSSVLASSQAGQLARYNIVMFATHGLMPAEVQGLFQPALRWRRKTVKSCRRFCNWRISLPCA
jgi:hypothetical protein